MLTFTISANGNDMGCYVANTPAEALDAYAADAGYENYADVVVQFSEDTTVAIEIDTDAICEAVTESTGFTVLPIFQECDGNGVAVVDGNSYDNWQQLSESIGKNCWDFKADVVKEFTPGFIGYTNGLEANSGKQIGKMVCVSFERNKDGSVTLKAVNGRNLGILTGITTVSAEQFQNRPCGTGEGVSEARWALRHVGWSLMTDDCEE